MVLETVRMSSKGQIVIPQDVREELHVQAGSLFAVVGSKDTIVLKRIDTPSRETLIKELGIFAKKAKKKLESKGIREEDLQEK